MKLFVFKNELSVFSVVSETEEMAKPPVLSHIEKNYTKRLDGSYRGNIVDLEKYKITSFEIGEVSEINL